MPRAAMIAGVLSYYRVAILAVVGLMAAGIWAFLSLPRMEDPEYDVRDSVVLTVWPGAGSREVESLVTRPLEKAISGHREVARVRSFSSGGLSLIVFRAAPDVPPGEVVDAIRERVAETSRRLPPGVIPPEIKEYNTAFIPVVVASLRGPVGFGDLIPWSERLERELVGLEGVSAVTIEGRPERQIRIAVDPERLARYQLPLTGLSELLRAEYAGVPGGQLDVGTTRYVVENPSELVGVEQLAGTVVGSFEGSVVHLRDVARIEDGFAEDRYAIRTGGERALLISVEKQEKTNTVAVAEGVRAVVEEVATELPAGMTLSVISDRGQSVAALLSNLGRNAVAGGVVLMLVVALFMGMRQAAVISVSIPLSLLIAFLIMKLTGVDLHQVSILGLVLALGMLVDSSLVVVESIALQLERGRPLTPAVISGVEEVLWPVVSSTLTTVAAFVPLLDLSGDVGTFISFLPLTLIYALMGSLLVALTVVPLLCFALWRSFPAHPATHGEPKVVSWYVEVARAALRHRAATLLLALAAFVGSLLLVPVIGVQFFPKAEKRFFLVDLRLPPQVTWARTDEVARRVEEILEGEEAIRDFTVNVGKGSPQVYYNEIRVHEDPSFAQILVNLRPNYAGGVEAYADSLRAKLQRVSGATVTPKILEQGPVGGIDVIVRILGSDLDTLARLAGEVKERIADLDGIGELRDGLGEKVPRLALELDREKAALRGVSTLAFSQTVAVALNGREVTRLRRAEEEVPVVVRLDPGTLSEVSSLDRLYLPSSLGTMVPLGEIATVSERSDYATIARKNGERTVNVEVQARGRLADDLSRAIEARLEGLVLPAGYRLEMDGKPAQRRDAFGGLWRALIIGLLSIYAILAIQFNSFVQPFVVLLTVPFGVVGALGGLYLTGNPFGFMAFVGVVSLAGIIINDSIVLTDYANYLQRIEGKALYDSLLEAGRRRFKPVLLTSATTITGMTPLAIWGGSLWSPLASALIFGLLTSTVLILVVLPVIYSLLVGPGEGRRPLRLLPRLGRRLLGRVGSG